MIDFLHPEPHSVYRFDVEKAFRTYWCAVLVSAIAWLILRRKRYLYWSAIVQTILEVVHVDNHSSSTIDMMISDVFFSLHLSYL